MGKKLFVLLLYTIMFVPLFAQQDMVLYHMHDVPQSNRLNPAVPLSHGWIVGIPVLGDMLFQVSAPVSYNDLGAGKNTFPADLLLSRLKSSNTVAFNTNINLFRIGYRHKKSYFELTVNERAFINGNVSKDLLYILMKGNADYVGQSVQSTISLNGMHYREYGFNFAHEIRPKTWLGARAKVLFGRMGLRSFDNTLRFSTHPDSYALTLYSDVLIQMSAPSRIQENEYGELDELELDLEARDFTFNTGNKGLAIDIGFNKEFENGVNLSASMLNLGYINWKQDTRSLKQHNVLHFANPMGGANNWESLVDSLNNFAKLKGKADMPFRQSLFPVFMGGVSMPVNDFLRAGATASYELHRKGDPWTASVTMYTKNLPVIDAGVSYTVSRYSYKNVGLCLAAQLGSFNIHFITDNILAAVRPFRVRSTSFQFGMNFRINRKIKEPRLAPLYDESELHQPNRNTKLKEKNLYRPTRVKRNP